MIAREPRTMDIGNQQIMIRSIETIMTIGHPVEYLMDGKIGNDGFSAKMIATEKESISHSNLAFVKAAIREMLAYGHSNYITYFSITKDSELSGLGKGWIPVSQDLLEDSAWFSDQALAKKLFSSNPMHDMMNQFVEAEHGERNTGMLAVYACGHTANLSGGEEKALQATFELCPECQITSRVTTSGLPVIIGTEKQVTWAESIRGDRAQTLSSRADLTKLFGPDVVDALLTKPYASWWIDTANVNVEVLMKAVAKERQFVEKGVIRFNELQGSKNAIDWAAKVRAVKVTQLVIAYLDIVVYLKNQTTDTVALKKAGQLLRRALQYQTGITNASMWIDIKDEKADALLRRQFEAVVKQESDLRESAAKLSLKGMTV